MMMILKTVFVEPVSGNSRDNVSHISKSTSIRQKTVKDVHWGRCEINRKKYTNVSHNCWTVSNGVLAVSNGHKKIGKKSYLQKLLNCTEFEWDESSFSQTDLVRAVYHLIGIDMIGIDMVVEPIS